LVSWRASPFARFWHEEHLQTNKEDAHFDKGLRYTPLLGLVRGYTVPRSPSPCRAVDSFSAGFQGSEANLASTPTFISSTLFPDDAAPTGLNVVLPRDLHEMLNA
jgi:hypothetical protein